MRKSESYVSIDIGSHSTKGLIISSTPEGYELLAHMDLKTRGIDGGDVKDAISLRDTLNQLISQIDETVNINRANVIISSSCGKFMLHDVKKEQIVSDGEKKMIDETMVETLKQSAIDGFGDNYQVLHIYPKRYMIDKTKSVFNPVGMSANHLEVELTVVTVDKSSSSLFEFLQDAMPQDFDFAASFITGAEGVLTDTEKENGVCVVELGHANTAVIVYSMGVPIRLDIIPLGMKHVVKDISVVFNTSLEEAERLLRTHGNAIYGEPSFGQQSVDFKGLDGRSSRSITKDELAKVIHARLREMLTKVKRVYRETCSVMPEFGPRGLPGGIVLLGGGAKVPRLLDLALDVFKSPVRIGTYNTSSKALIKDSDEVIDDPVYASALGGFVSLIEAKLGIEQPKKESTEGFFKRLVEIFKNLW
ncbi:MAG TPA: cell division protein FtsA [Pseudothermotoga sp.]|nr:cell division protein FtsA [Pseudothermotoga sp.]HOK82894.1 cell division protein FtsA [Pseudothermotoga sp.]HPP69933.1 cell division protein FtsA [Pseudothermotoga sp.]